MATVEEIFSKLYRYQKETQREESEEEIKVMAAIPCVAVGHAVFLLKRTKIKTIFAHLIN